MATIQEQKDAANRLTEIYEAYWAGAYRDDEIPSTLDEVMLLLGKFVED